MQVVIFSTILKDKDIPYVQALFEVLREEQISAYVHRPYFNQINGKIAIKQAIGIFDDHLDFKVKNFDMVITLGGDGTILRAVTLIRDSNVPIMGINLGRLGFLASVDKESIRKNIILVKKGLYEIDERQLLYLESNLPIFEDTRFALNDCTLLKRDTSSMIIIHTYINGNYLNSYWADGLIIATPTGSTGYSLSCGGPIIFPRSGNFVITPVAPHNLNVRPIVISDESVITFEVEGRAENFLCTLDSRFATITADYQLAVRKGDFTVRLVQLPQHGFMQTIRNKLDWGNDVRNH